jgi:hypothetical protein
LIFEIRTFANGAIYFLLLCLPIRIGICVSFKQVNGINLLRFVFPERVFQLQFDVCREKQGIAPLTRPDIGYYGTNGIFLSPEYPANPG